MKFIITVLLLTLMTQVHSQNNFQIKADHTAIRVKNLEVSANFYSEILGLDEIYNAGLGEGFRWFQLNDKIQIHLIESEDEIVKHKGVHLALNTPDLSGLMQFLKSKNIHFENWLGEAMTTNTRPDGIKQIYLQDPDGYWIEINDNQL